MIEQASSPAPTAAAPRAPVMALLVLLLATLVLGGGEVACVRDAYDDGLAGQCAERVLHGELPHRDYCEPYTGGLSALHAALFALFGTSGWVLRATSAGIALTILLSTWALAARAVGPWWAVVVALAALCWGPLQYLAPSPSWWNIAAALLALVAFVRHADGGGRGWLFAAGLLGGLSVLAKVTGAFQLGAGLLHLVDLERRESATSEAGADPGAPRGRLVMVSAAVAVAVLGGATLVLRRHLLALEGAHYLPPIVAACVALVVWERREGRGPARPRLLALGRRLAPFLLGAALPLLALLAFYAWHGALGDLARGLLVLPQRRIDLVARPLVLDAAMLLPLIALPLLLVGAEQRARPAARAVVVAAALLACAVVYLGRTDAVHARVFAAVRAFVSVLGVCAVVGAGPRDRSGASCFMGWSAAALVSLIQYPFAHPMYLGFVMPVALVAGAHLAPRVRAPGRALLAVASVFLAAHGAASVSTRHQAFYDEWVSRDVVALRETSLPRARGLRLSPGDATLLEQLAAFVDARSAPGDWFYAAPDQTQLVFFIARRSPVRTVFDLFDEDYGAPTRPARIVAELDAKRVRFALLRWTGVFSGKPDPALVRALDARFPNRLDSLDVVLWWR